MRKLTICIFLLGGVFFSCGRKSSLPSVLEHRVSIAEGSEGIPLTWDDLMDELVRADVVFVGEVHDDSLTHIVELELLKRIFYRHRRLAVALEMFERDVQEVLDDYLDGRMTEADFLAVSRPWGNYETAYRPLVAFARENRLSVLAMNVPRRYANRVAMLGEKGLATLADSERVWVAGTLKALDSKTNQRPAGPP